LVRISFTPNLLRHVQTPADAVEGDNIGAAFEAYFQINPSARSYVLDDQGKVRKHIAIFLNRDMIPASQALATAVEAKDELYVAQALSGG
jgi:molybdopterin synthase sulfur carrier subunit